MSGRPSNCALRGFKSNSEFDAAKGVQVVAIAVKSKFGVDYRRILLRLEPLEQTFDNFAAIIKELHEIVSGKAGIGDEFVLSYTSGDGDTLPISNDDNLRVCLHSPLALLRVTIQRRCESHEEQLGYGSSARTRKKSRVLISQPSDFRRVSSIVDADILPHQFRRVKLCKYYTNKPLGFYIKEGWAERITPWGIIPTPGIFISRLLENGLAASTNLLSKGDEILEVNGIDTTGKSIDQVTDMMHANAKNLILTVKPIIQTHLTLRIPPAYLAPPSYGSPDPYFNPLAPHPTGEVAYPYRIRNFDQSPNEMNRRMAKSVLIEVDPVYKPPGYRYHNERLRNSSQYSSGGDRSSSSKSTSDRYTPQDAPSDASQGRQYGSLCTASLVNGHKTSFETFSRNSTWRVSDRVNPASTRPPRSVFRNGDHHRRPYSVHFDSVEQSGRSAKPPSNITVF
ncbi:hypothetical protein QR680_005562 [Steinernema hermaphroditum]|uniref:PDZ domain-containing protein n=1 Tax=Steinernema hermaphroditum TaxID=289476 RepID=A0AA39HTW8_9BILA|nr:hypothetical protein QR680_005562 [Steinernema hermaphroditum]